MAARLLTQKNVYAWPSVGVNPNNNNNREQLCLNVYVHSLEENMQTMMEAHFKLCFLSQSDHLTAGDCYPSGSGPFGAISPLKMGVTVCLCYRIGTLLVIDWNFL